MENIVPIASAIGVAIALAVVMPMVVSGQRKKLGRIKPLLRESGGMTLDEIAQALGTGVFGKGYLMQALDQMVGEGKVTKEPPPAGHPRLRIFKDTRYVLIGNEPEQR